MNLMYLETKDAFLVRATMIEDNVDIMIHCAVNDLLAKDSTDFFNELVYEIKSNRGRELESQHLDDVSRFVCMLYCRLHERFDPREDPCE